MEFKLTKYTTRYGRYKHVCPRFLVTTRSSSRYTCQEEEINCNEKSKFRVEAPASWLDVVRSFELPRWVPGSGLPSVIR